MWFWKFKRENIVSDKFIFEKRQKASYEIRDE
jgi:hypothetical protein